MSYWGEYERTRPRATRGGIKLQEKRGGTPANWWAKRWTEVLNACGLGGRLTRGRSYARSGQVLSIDVAAGEVTAKVQGSASKPYKVRMGFTPFTSAQWDAVVEELAGQAIYAAGMLAGEMPQDIERVFDATGLSLLPARMSDLETECSCPDWSNPCKHTAAVYCLLGEEFDRDPFLIFALRGMAQDELRARLTGATAGEETAPAAPVPQSLAADPALYWRGAPGHSEPSDPVRPPPVNAPLLRRLGGFPFWRGDEPLLETLNPVYSAASDAGLAVFLAQRGSDAT